MNSHLVYEGQGVYCPSVVDNITVWQLDKTGNPIMGVNLESVEQGGDFASVIHIVSYNEDETVTIHTWEVKR